MFLKLPYRFIFLTLIILLVACTAHDKQAENVINDAQQLLETMPDSALATLDSIKGRQAEWPKSQRMQYELVYAQAQNKAYVDFSTDSIVLEVAKYYDKHGSSNERMMANYLVGCAYRDLGDAPTALKYMNIAIDAVDENSKDCDLSTLMRIHSQMGGLYQDVASFDNELIENSRAEQIAWLIGDTLSALNLKWHRACCLYDTYQQTKALSIIDSIEDFCQKHNLPKEPLMFYPIKIDALLQNENINEAGRLLCAYEQETGITPQCPNDDRIASFYYKNKGCYYAMSQEMDSAIIMYRLFIKSLDSRTMPTSERQEVLEVSYRGLMSAYSLKQQQDSVIKYANLYCDMKDSINSNHSSEQMFRMQSLYNYSKIQTQALLAEKNVFQLRITIVLVVSVAILLGIIMWIAYKKHIRTEKQKKIRANIEYQSLLTEMDKSAEELCLFKADSERFMKEKEAEIKKLQTALNMYQANTISVEQWDNERVILGCEIVKHLRTLASQGKKATDDELKSLYVIAQNGFPKFFATITKDVYGLTKLETQICMLIRFRFIPSEIAVLTVHSSQRITNIKSTINKKIFGKPGAKTLEANLLSLK